MMRARGFTLIELVVAIVLSAMIVGFIATLMTSPIDAYVDQSERARVSASAELLTARLRADLRKAVPFSVRVRNSGGRSVLEMLETQVVSYYLPAGTHLGLGLPDNPQSELAFGASGGDDFVLFASPPGINPARPRYLVIGNQGSGSSNDAYALAATTLVVEDDFTEDPSNPGHYKVTLPGTFSFGASNVDPHRRAYWVSTPVSYICNPTTGTIRRYSGYDITNSAPSSEASSQLSGATQAVLAENAAACRFTCDNVNGDRDICSIVLLRANLTRASASGERLALLEQISVLDSP
jgi:MSHA biogenesis protein MshO